MKKIVSIVLALVLVLAIAAPAMAITGYLPDDTTSTVTASAPFTGLKITLIDSASAGLGVLGLNAVAANRAYVANEVIYGKVEITASAKTTWDAHDYKNPELRLSSDAVLFQGVNVYQIAANATTDVLLTEGATGTVTNVTDSGNIKYNAAKTLVVVKGLDRKNYTVLFSAIVRAQGSITASLRAGDKQLFIDSFASAADINACTDNKVSIYDDNGHLLYEVAEDGNNYEVTIKYGDNKNHVVKFSCEDAENVCSKIDVDDNEVKFTVPISNEGAVLTAIGTYTAATDAAGKVTTFADLKAAYEEVMNYFGFDYDAKGLLLDAHFVCKLHSFNMNDAVSVNLYTAAITVPDADVDIPQTGDAATTLGFVMIAMAIVAAAAVAYKKVRA